MNAIDRLNQQFDKVFGGGMTDLDREMRRLAYAARNNSPDPSTKVGAIVYDKDAGLFGSGWNHFPTGTPFEFWHDREIKYKLVIHAEAAALLQAGRKASGATLGCTAHPCVSCAVLAVEAGVKRVVCSGEPWRDDPAVIETVNLAKGVFQRAGTEVVYV